MLILQHEKIERVSVVGHSMGGMLTARFATQYPKAVERLVIYNPIGLTDGRFDRPMTPIDETYQQTLKTDYQSIRGGLSRYVAHDPKAWNAEFELYTRIRYSWTLSAEWPRLAMVQALIGQMLYQDPVVYDWPHIQVPTLAFGGAEDMLLGPAARFQERMQFLAKSIPNGNGQVLLIPGLGHVPHLEAPGEGVAAARQFLKEGWPRPQTLKQVSYTQALFSVSRSSSRIFIIVLVRGCATTCSATFNTAARTISTPSSV